MVFLAIESDIIDQLAGGDFIAVQNDAGEVVAARVIGPVAGEPVEAVRWRIEGRYRVDAAGTPMSEIAPATSRTTGTTTGHDWGALGLPEGLDTRVRPVDDPLELDELTLARTSSGHRSLDRNPLLTMTPGDRVTVDGAAATVVSIDRRKRVVEIDRDGDVTAHDFDDVQTQETT